MAVEAIHHEQEETSERSKATIRVLLLNSQILLQHPIRYRNRSERL